MGQGNWVLNWKTAVDFIVLFADYLVIYNKKLKEKKPSDRLVCTLMYIYLTFVLFFTLMPIITSIPFIFDHPYYPMNLIPFIDVIKGRDLAVPHAFLNVIMLFPFGMMLPVIDKKNDLKRVILYTVLVSIAIELIQPLLNEVRASDITDIITNTLGGIVGYTLYRIFKPTIEKILDLIDSRG